MFTDDWPLRPSPTCESSRPLGQRIPDRQVRNGLDNFAHVNRLTEINALGL